MLQKEDKGRESWNGLSLQLEEGVTFFENNIVRALFSANAFFCLLSFVLLWYFVRTKESIIILHYNVYFGVDIQGFRWQAYIFPIAGVLFFIAHSFFAYHFYRRRERIASYLMLFSSVLLALSIVIVSTGILLINY